MVTVYALFILKLYDLRVMRVTQFASMATRVSRLISFLSLSASKQMRSQRYQSIQLSNYGDSQLYYAKEEREGEIATSNSIEAVFECINKENRCNQTLSPDFTDAAPKSRQSSCSGLKSKPYPARTVADSCRSAFMRPS